MKRKLKCKSSKYVLPSNRTLDILKIGVGTHNWMYVRKKNFHVSYTWYKSLVLLKHACNWSKVEVTNVYYVHLGWQIHQNDKKHVKKFIYAKNSKNFTLSTDPAGHTRHGIYVWAQLDPTNFSRTPDIDQNVCSWLGIAITSLQSFNHLWELSGSPWKVSLYCL